MPELFTLAQFQAATKSTADNAQKYYQPMLNALKNFGIIRKDEIAAILGTVRLESAALATVKEDLYYKDAERLAGLFKRVFDTNMDKVISPAEVAAAQKCVRNPELLNEKLYGGFCGRGPGQLTWEGNYRKVGAMLGQDYVKNPALLEEPGHGSMAMVAFWVSTGMGKIASDPKAVRRAWNGPAMLGLKEYTQYYNEALKVLS